MRDFIGQTRLLARLSQHALEDRLSHGYVLSGPRQIGKHTLAIRLAQTLNCPSRQPGGCGTCSSCRKIDHGAHPDVVLVTRLVNREKLLNEAKVIAIDQVRSMQTDLALRPLEGTKRVVIIDDAADLSPDAQTALLKTLEEPPRHAILLLLTPTPSSLRDTIISRAQHLALHFVPVPELADALTKRFGKDAARHAGSVGGRPGLAIRLAQDDVERTTRKALDTEFYRLVGAGMTERFAWAADMSDERDTQKRARAIDDRFTHWSELIRDAALSSGIRERYALRGDRIDESVALGAAAQPRAWVDTLLLMERMHEDLDFNANARTMLELFALKLPHARIDRKPVDVSR